LEETRDLAKKQNPDIKVLISHLDVSNEASVTDFYDKVIVQFGRIDFSANVAGYGGTAAPITETSEAEYDKLFAVNQRGVRVLCLHYATSQPPNY
jgi:NAD(P)-dependent dehydrogenase (short-subunit alcohol dehydrogenase family)